MSAETDDDDGKGIAWLPLLVSAAVVALIVIALIASGGDPSSADEAAPPPAGTTTTTTATAPATTGEATATAPAPATDGATATAPDDAAIPAEVRDDPVVKRLARGRSLPFTAGPWRREVWRDAVYGRLRPATQQRAEKVDVDGGYGILIQ